MEIISSVSEFKEINGNKYVKIDDKFELIEDTSKHPPYNENQLYEINRITKVYIKKDLHKILTELPIAHIDIYRVYSKNGKLIPTSEGIPLNEVLVKVHWEDYLDLDGNDYTYEDINTLGVRYNQGKNGKGIKKLWLDDNTFMRKIMCEINLTIKGINSKLPSTAKKAIIVARTSSGKTDEEVSLTSQVDCGYYLVMILGLRIFDVFIVNGMSAGSKGKEPPNLKQINFQNCINQSGYDTLIFKNPNRLTRNMSGFLDLFLNNLKPRGINIITFDDDNKQIDSSKDIFLMNISDRHIEIISDRNNYRKNSLPDGLYMSIINKSVFLRLINKAEEQYETICKMAQQTADIRKKRKIEELEEQDNLQLIEDAFKSGDKTRCLEMIKNFKLNTGSL